MFRKMKVSLTQPPLTIFYMKDKWTQVLKYIFFIPLFLLLPLIIRSFISTDMSVNQYETLVNRINSDFRFDNVEIIDGVLHGTTDHTMMFGYYTLYVPTGNQRAFTIGIVFEEEHLAIYSSNIEITRATYDALDLSNHDFSDLSIQSSRALARAIKTLIDGEPFTIYIDFIFTYLTGLFNYITMVLLVSLMTLLFMFNVDLPYRYRFKLSVYLTTIWVLAELLLTLFGYPSWTFISTLVVYIYHIWAYRSFKVIPKE
jgi:hypothetical protein